MMNGMIVSSLRLLEARPLFVTLVALFITIGYEFVGFWLLFELLPTGSVVGFVSLLIPAFIATLLALYATGATVRNVLRGISPWYYLLLAPLVLLCTLAVALMSFYFLVFALFGFS